MSDNVIKIDFRNAAPKTARRLREGERFASAAEARAWQKQHDAAHPFGRILDERFRLARAMDYYKAQGMTTREAYQAATSGGAESYLIPMPPFVRQLRARLAASASGKGPLANVVRYVFGA